MHTTRRNTLAAAAIAFAVLASLSTPALAQDTHRLTREEILAMTTDELSELPLEQLMAAVETLGVSSVDELFAIIMNKNVSSASKKEESSFTSPMASTTITRDELRMWGATTIEDAFRLIPGMIVTQKTNGVYDIQMRGLNNIPDNNMLLYTENNNVLLMIDGRISHCYAMGALYMSQLPISIEDVQRIEVVRGASSALYGPNAVQGVINIITEKPSGDSKTVSGSLQMGNLGTFAADFALRKSIGDKLSVGVTVNGQRRHRPTDKIYVIPTASGNHFLASSDAGVPAGTTYADAATLGAQIAQGTLTNISEGAWLTTSEIERMKVVMPNSDGSLTIYDAVEPESPMGKMFPSPDVARQNVGLNAYVSFRPREDLAFDLTGGFQDGYNINTSVGDDVFPVAGQTSRTGYVALDSRISDFHFNGSLYYGPQDYTVGVPGFDVDNFMGSAEADYSFNIGKHLSVRPQLSYLHVYFRDNTPYYTDPSTGVRRELSGFFRYDAMLTDFSPSVRLDFSKDAFRAIVAVRGDKTNYPDKWNMSYQVQASYTAGDKNFLRLGYGRAFRSANMVGANTNFEWERTNLGAPNYIKFEGNPEADLVSIDDIEFGWRFKPTPALLLDFEAYYSKSRDYGALKCDRSIITANYLDLRSVAKQSLDALYSDDATLAALTTGGEDALRQYIMSNVGAVSSVMQTRSYFKYGNMPFEVSQFGLGLNVDWVVSSKVVLKLNANYQHTTIDNYYAYSQSQNILLQFASAQTSTASCMGGLMANMLGQSLSSYATYGGDKEQGLATGRIYADNVLGGHVRQSVLESAQAAYNAMSDTEKAAYLTSLHQAGVDGSDINGYSLYYALKYGLSWDPETQSYVFGNGDAIVYEQEDGHVHKATPAVYGMLGAIYKPMKRLNVSAYANFIGKRSYLTAKGDAELDSRLTLNAKVGYLPAENVEVFVNGSNLFNTKEVEFPYCDKIGGLYTIGVNFSF